MHTIVAHPSRQGSQLSRGLSSVARGAAVEAMRSFLVNSVDNVTSEPAAFQLRCQHVCEGTSGSKDAVIIVGGKCTLWKLNQIIAECFDASEHEFAHEAKKGTTVLGSRFLVSRPLPPGQCGKVTVCSRHSAAQVGTSAAFIDDQNFSVAQFFRGRSNRSSLQRDTADA